MALRLECTQCGTTLPGEAPDVQCPACGEPLEYRGYDTFSTLPGWSLSQSLLQRYAALLPHVESCISMGEGFTPLTDMPRLAASISVGRLSVKNESLNPTWSFKDRGTVVAVADAIHRKSQALGVVSTGNMAASVSAYGARAGLPVIVLVSAAILSTKVAPIAAYGPHIVKVRGDYSELYHRSLKLQELGVRFLNSDAPARVEGSKTIAFEIWEQCSGKVPDCVVVPTSSGGNIRGIMKGFHELRSLGLEDRVPMFVCAQARGCAPICAAYDRGLDRVQMASWPGTVAHAIENPRPPSGGEVLRRLRDGGGLCVAVSDDDILGAQDELAGEGLFVQPAAAVPVAAVAKLTAEGRIDPSSHVVCIATGSGLKYPDALAGMEAGVAECAIADLASEVMRWLQSRGKGEHA